MSGKSAYFQQVRPICAPKPEIISKKGRVRSAVSRNQKGFNAKAQSGKGASKDFEQEHAEVTEKEELCQKCTIRRSREDSRHGKPQTKGIQRKGAKLQRRKQNF